jgi:hypothetical protein
MPAVATPVGAAQGVTDSFKAILQARVSGKSTMAALARR